MRFGALGIILSLTKKTIVLHVIFGFARILEFTNQRLGPGWWPNSCWQLQDGPNSSYSCHVNDLMPSSRECSCIPGPCNQVIWIICDIHSLQRPLRLIMWLDFAFLLKIFELDRYLAPGILKWYPLEFYCAVSSNFINQLCPLEASMLMELFCNLHCPIWLPLNTCGH